MTATQPTAKSLAWPRLGWWMAVVLVLVLQFGFIFALGKRSETRTRPKNTAPALQLRAERADQFLPLRDPTLFILPHREGFSGRAWLQIASQTVPQYTWSEPTEWLGLRTETLGNVFNEFMRTNLFAATSLEVFPEAKFSAPRAALPAPLVTHSSIQIRGSLLERAVVSQPELPSLSATDLYANSPVQVLVDMNGNVLSAVLVSTGSGPTEADRRALELAKSVRFAPITPRGTDRTASVNVGTIVFQWQTIPATNTPPNL